MLRVENLRATPRKHYSPGSCIREFMQYPGEETIDRLVGHAKGFYEMSLAYVSSSEVLFQFGIIVVAIIPAWILSGLVEKKLEGAVCLGDHS